MFLCSPRRNRTASGESWAWFREAQSQIAATVPAEARVKGGGSVLITSPRVPVPVAVRYAWANDPVECNLYNAAGLPAAPFRTDGANQADMPR